MAEEASAATPPPLNEIIDMMRAKRSISPGKFTGDPAILAQVREYERQANAPLPAPSLASAKADDLDRLALLDGLTELYNYRAFLKELKAELSRSKRYKHSVSVSMLTIDEYDSIVEKYGVLTGEAVLKVVSNVLRGVVREVDVIARYSEHHFVLVLPSTHASGAALVAERIRQRIGNQAIAHNWQSFSVTASIGVAASPLNATEYDELIAQAGQALEFALARGGDRVFSI